jgi:hypothetical protein
MSEAHEARKPLAIQPLPSSWPTTDADRKNMARNVLHSMIQVIKGQHKNVDFPTSYMEVHKLNSCNGAELVTTVRKLASRVCAHAPEHARVPISMMIRDMCMYYERTYVVRHNMMPCTELFAKARDDLVAWAMDVFNRRKLKALWIECHFKPGGAYAKRIAETERWSEKGSKRVRTDTFEHLEQPQEPPSSSTIDPGSGSDQTRF